MGWTWTGDTDTIPATYRRRERAAKNRRYHELAKVARAEAKKYEQRGDYARAAQARRDAEDFGAQVT